MNNNLFFRLCSVFVLLWMVCLSPTTLSNEKLKTKSGQNTINLSATIDSLLNDPELAPCFIGLTITSLKNDSVLYSKNNNKLFHPASTMKVLTTAAAVSALPPAYTFTTTISINAIIEKGTLLGDLSIVGTGDPLLKTSDLDTLVEQIWRAGIRKIKGNIIGDVTAFDDLYWGAGWMWDDEPEAYEAFISPLTVNSNSITFKVKPGKKDGDRLTYDVEPSIPFYTITNNGVTSKDTTIPEVKVSRPKRTNEFAITGRMATNDTIKEFELSAWQPEIYFLHLLKERLKAKGIEVTGKTIVGVAVPGKKIAGVWNPLDSVLHQVNKPSDNLAAENLLKTLGKEKFGKPGTAEHGLSVVKKYLLNCGVDTSLVILADGSGLSFYNAISPDVLTAILKDQYKRKSFNRFYESLPAAGIEGTLKRRMKGTKAEGNVHAKTGSLNGVSTLTGYVKTADAQLLCFSFMSNHFPGESKVIRKLQDRIMEILANFKM